MENELGKFEMVVFDTETTGLLMPSNVDVRLQPKIIEFYGVRLDQDFQIISELETFIDPEEPITKEITRITNIKQSDLDGAPKFGDVAPKILTLFSGADLSVAHNLAFDNDMVKNCFMMIGNEFPGTKHNLCTVEEYVRNHGHRISLSALYKKLFGKYFKAHRAKSDVFALVRCLHQLYEDGEINLDIYRH